jgi:unsaturated chondroitin disaccharide hydrolase
VRREADLETALARALDALEAALPAIAEARARGLVAFITEDGRWRLAPARSTTDPHTTWTGGFVAGQLWLAAGLRPGPGFEAEARAVTDLLAPRAADGSTHDLGFLFWPSAVLGYAGTGDPDLRELGLAAARTLAGRRHPSGAIQVLGELGDPRHRGRAIVDTLPNLELLWWAEREGDKEAGRTARAHARLAAETFLRDDGTTWQALRFGDDGSVLERGTIQGRSPETTWSRGQAWAILGFAQAWRATREDWARSAAERSAAAFLARLPPDLVPPWDLDAPRDSLLPAPTDASAGAIAASGLLELGDADGARSLLEPLAARFLLRDRGDGLLHGCCFHRPFGEGLDCATAWGDFFLLDALARLART